MMKSLCGCVCLVGGALLLSAPSLFAQECTVADIKVLKKADPNYPKRARERGIEGYVALEFSIGVDGKAKDVKVVESEPTGTFDRAGMRAVMKTRFQTCMVDSEPVEIAKAYLKFHFKL